MQKRSDSTQRSAHTQANQGASNRLLLPVIVLFAVAGAVFAFKHFHQAPPPAADASQNAPAEPVAQAQAPANPPPAAPAPAIQQPHASAVALAPSAPARAASSPLHPVSRPGPLPATSGASVQLIQQLFQSVAAQGPLTPEQAANFKQSLKQLVDQGAAAVPAIRQFLDRNQDVALDSAGGANQVGFSSLRTSLFDALKQIGGPESTDAFLGTLQSTTNPSEIALVAGYLDAQAPGEYRQDALAAAKNLLDQSSQSQGQANAPKHDVGPLFQVIQKYGDMNSIPELVKASSDWPFYSTLALAGLPDGQGLSSLLERLQDPNQIARPQNALAVQLLAQMAPQYPEAANALLEQVKQNQLPDWVWQKIADGLGGDQYQLTKPDPGANAVLGVIPGLKTYHLQDGNQTYYSLPYDPSMAADQAAQRRALIDQFLGAAQSPVALQALQAARASLGAPHP